MNPRVSVIIPTHNRAALLQRALASVLSQTCGDLEVIVVENNCTDGTAAMLAAISDPRLRRVNLTDKSGACAARNAGIEIARAPLIAFQDDDDIWLPDKLERQMAALEAAGPGAALCLCGYIGLTAQGVYARFARAQFEEMDFDRAFAVRDWSLVATPAWLLRREHLERAGPFDEELPARNDWELALRLAAVGRIVFVDAPLYVQDQIHVSTMRKNEVAFARALQHIERKHGARWALRHDTQAVHSWFIGKGELIAGDKPLARRWLKRSIRFAPWNPKAWALLASSYVDERWMRALLALKVRVDLMRMRRSK